MVNCKTYNNRKFYELRREYRYISSLWSNNLRFTYNLKYFSYFESVDMSPMCILWREYFIGIWSWNYSVKSNLSQDTIEHVSNHIHIRYFMWIIRSRKIKIVSCTFRIGSLVSEMVAIRFPLFRSFGFFSLMFKWTLCTVLLPRKI